MQRALIIIPTYNEKDNIRNITTAVLAQQKNITDAVISVLVVDDNSPDGTADLVRKMQRPEEFGPEKVHLMQRMGKMGLGTAYVAGFKYGLEHGFDYIFEMDADFSHDPNEIPVFLREIKNYDLVIGSRYISGANVANWPLRRLLLSYYANMYARTVTGIKVQDATGGFKCFRRKVLE
ncbi:MAG TPA: polyprenol monophosphomannose synthase, partial [Candidatus Kapabacteria bacterium]|nr:polyprenol monophosphomannose synthase [Candidatus Kapabacteria bacterium]